MALKSLKFFLLKSKVKTELHTSDTGLRGDLRSVTLGLDFGVLVALFRDETESASDPDVLSWRAVRGVAGDFL